MSRSDPYVVGSVPAHMQERVHPAVWRRMTVCAERGDRWPLVLTGGVGTGKTCAALCLMDTAPTRRYWSVTTLCEQLIEVMQGRAEYGMVRDNVAWWWRRYRDYECVIVDELGARGRVSDYQYETVKRSIDERHGLPSIYISNKSLDELASIYDDRIASRLAAGTVILFRGDDRRIERGTA